MTTMFIALLLFVTGAIVGSFLNVVIDRLPRGQSLLAPPSHCAACSRRLSPLELVPVLSYLWLRGRCRTCGAAIGRRVLIVELAGGAIAIVAWLLYGLTIAALLAALFAAIFLTLSVLDIEHRKVYGMTIAPSVALAVLAAPWWPPAGLMGALIGCAVACVPYVLLYYAAARLYGPGKGLGWGDVKVAALMGLVSGWPGAIIALYTAILGGGLAAVALVLSGRRRRRDTLPTVPLFALGALAAVLWQRGVIQSVLRLISL